MGGVCGGVLKVYESARLTAGGGGDRGGDRDVGDPGGDELRAGVAWWWLGWSATNGWCTAWESPAEEARSRGTGDCGHRGLGDPRPTNWSPRGDTETHQRANLKMAA